MIDVMKLTAYIYIIRVINQGIIFINSKYFKHSVRICGNAITIFERYHSSRNNFSSLNELVMLCTNLIKSRIIQWIDLY